MTPPTAAKPHCIFFWKGRPQEGTTYWPDFHHTQFFFLSNIDLSVYPWTIRAISHDIHLSARSLQFTLMSVGRGCLKTSHGACLLAVFCHATRHLLLLSEVALHPIPHSRNLLRGDGASGAAASSCSRALHDDGRANFITDRTRYGETRVRKGRRRGERSRMPPWENKSSMYACMGELVACMLPMTSPV